MIVDRISPEHIGTLKKIKDIVIRYIDQFLSLDPFKSDSECINLIKTQFSDYKSSATRDNSLYFKEIKQLIAEEFIFYMASIAAKHFDRRELKHLELFVPRILITLPSSSVPSVVADYINVQNTHGSIMPFIKPQFQNATFFLKNPWHSDAIDFPNAREQFASVLCPLTPRSASSTALCFAKTPTDLYGCTEPAPYTDNMNGIVTLHDVRTVYDCPTLDIGDIISWNGKEFHCVRQNSTSNPAISLRYTFSQNALAVGVRETSTIERVILDRSKGHFAHHCNSTTMT